MLPLQKQFHCGTNSQTYINIHKTTQKTALVTNTQNIPIIYHYTKLPFVLAQHKMYLCNTTTQIIPLCYHYTNNPYLQTLYKRYLWVTTTQKHSELPIHKHSLFYHNINKPVALPLHKQKPLCYHYISNPFV